MIIQTQNTSFIFNEKASLVSLTIDGEEMLADGGERRPLFTVRLRHPDGCYEETTAFDYRDISFPRSDDPASVLVCFSHNKLLPLDVSIRMEPDIQDNTLKFYAKIQNDTGSWVEFIDFPEITVKNDFVATGGTGRLFWPAMEGCVVEDPALRDRTGFKYRPMEYPSIGCEGYYPGATQMQFMAYYTEHAGFYLGAHDVSQMTKSIEYHPHMGGVRMEYRIYLAGRPNSVCETGFPMVFKAGIRDWMDAADYYRTFATTHYPLPEKIGDNQDLPKWYNESPLVISYPVRGEKDTGDMSPNRFFPYSEALPVIDAYAEKLHTKILVLLMHWEGTAPWAPPYIWPPFGGEDALRAFMDQLHKQGHILGVYASGIGWTNQSNLWPDYTRQEQFDAEHLKSVMCAAPDQSVPHSAICNGPIRWGHDMCPSQYFTHKTAVNEILKSAEFGVDYIQYFDQNHGGNPCLCYSKDHGHPPVPGLWNTECTKALDSEIQNALHARGLKTVIGSESGASEAYLPYLKFSDLRFNINFWYAKPVPAYSYVYHEYLINFMGNLNSFYNVIPGDSNPYSMHFLLAYSFTAGDLLTVMLNGKGQVHWSWCTPWEVTPPDQDSILTLIDHLLALRRQEAYPYLQEGRMIRPLTYTCDSFEMKRSDGSILSYPSVLSSAWQSTDGHRAQVFVNYTPKERQIAISEANNATEFSLLPFSCRLVRIR